MIDLFDRAVLKETVAWRAGIAHDLRHSGSGDRADLAVGVAGHLQGQIASSYPDRSVRKYVDQDSDVFLRHGGSRTAKGELKLVDHGYCQITRKMPCPGTSRSL